MVRIAITDDKRICARGVAERKTSREFTRAETL
jgi:hypothetical protein